MKPVVIVTGAGGLIGQYFMKTASRWSPEWNIRGLTRADVDLTDQSNVERTWHDVQPQAVIHCAALSRTKDCEQDPELAQRTNVETTAYLAHLSQNIPFIFLSSGEVFDGAGGWYGESDRPNPINVYGRTKVEAEQVVLRNPLHSVIRIVLTAGTSAEGNRSFVEDMSRAAKAGQTIALYTDEFRCPLPAGVIVRAVWELLERNRPGLYHLGGSERLSRWEIGQVLLPWYPELEGRLVESSARQHAGAPRPPDLSLQCEKIQRLLSFPIPGFRGWLTNRGDRGGDRGKDLWDYLE